MPQNEAAAPWSDWDAGGAGFECEPGVGLTIADDIENAASGSRWLCWDEVIRLHKWLGQKIEAINDEH